MCGYKVERLSIAKAAGPAMHPRVPSSGSRSGHQDSNGHEFDSADLNYPSLELEELVLDGN